MAGLGELLLGLLILVATGVVAAVRSLMAGSFPTSITPYSNPGPTDTTATEIGTRTHDEFHSDNNDDLEQVMTKLGTGASTASANTVLRGTGSGATAFGQIVSADITDDTIVDADVNSAAAIALTKLAHVGAGNVLKSSGSANVGGQVATADIAAGAVSQGSTVIGTTSSPTTATSTPADLAQMTITQTLVGNGLLFVLFECEFTQTLAGATTVFDLWVGGSAVLQRQLTTVTANERNMMVFGNLRTSPAGSTTIKIQWWVSSGTGTAEGNRRALTVLELKK